MVDSGIKPDPEFLSEFAKFIKLDSCQYDYIILKIGKKNGKDMVIVEDSPEKGSMNEKYKDATDLEEGETPNWRGLYDRLSSEKNSRFAICYISYKTSDKRDVTKLTFIYWNPDTGGMRDKMIYSSTKLSLKAKLATECTLVEASENSDIEYKTIKSLVQKK